MNTKERYSNYERMLQERLETENQLLPFANQPRPGEQYYGNKRERIADFCFLNIQEFVNQGPTKVLELGTGQGKALLRLLQYFDGDLGKLTLEGTSLQRLPEHQALEEQGIILHAPILAEHMPLDWTDTYDFVLTDSVLGWTEIPQAISEIARIIKPGGMWIGFEHSNVKARQSIHNLYSVINFSLKEKGLENSLDDAEIINHKHIHEIYPFVVQF